MKSTVASRLIGIGLAGVLLATGYAQSFAAPGRQATLKMALVVGQSPSPFYNSMQCGAQAAAKQYNVQLSVQGAPVFAAPKQIPLVDAAVRTGIKALLLVPTDPRALIVPVQQAKKAGVVVGTVDGQLATPVDLFNLRTNNVQGGAMAAAQMRKFVHGSGSYLVIAYAPGLTGDADRANGFVNAMKRTAGATLLPVAYVQNDPNKAAQVVQSTLLAHPNLKGIFTTNDVSANGAASGLRAAHAQGKVKLIAYDADPQEVSNLRSGVFDALVVQASWQEGHEGIKLLAKYLRHQITKAQIGYQRYAKNLIATRSNMTKAGVKKYFYTTSC